MCRMYVIMREREGRALPYDVVHSMTRADELCTEYEAQDSNHIYYWYEIISSENE